MKVERAGFILLLSLFLWVVIEDNNAWSKFKLDHECVMVVKMSGDTYLDIGVGTSGDIVTTISTTHSKTGYKCNDGMTYWR